MTAVDIVPTQPKSVFGRSAELVLIGSILEGAAVDGGAVLIVGEPGIGKTALLDAAAEAAAGAGMRLLRAAGAEFEADVPFSGLNQALFPLSDGFERLSSAYREALAVALGFGDGPPPDRPLMLAATLALLRQAGDVQPVLLVVDDAHWLDRSSAVAFGSVARRPRGAHVGLIATSRSATGPLFEGSGLTALELQPLDDIAASDLLESRFPSLADNIRQRVLDEARGIPLALVELGAAYTAERRPSAVPGPRWRPLGHRLQTLFDARVNELPTATRRVLLLAALDGTGDLGMLEAASGLGAVETLLPARDAQLVDFDGEGRQMRFRHPLVATTIVGAACGGEPRAAHRALADAALDQPERRAWHLAGAVSGPDEPVAELLEQAAGRALRRGDAVGAVAALLRAADLSPDGADRSRRLAEAAYTGADISGELKHVSQRLDQARRADPDLRGSLEAAVAGAHLLLNGEGDVDIARRVLVGAIETKAGAWDAEDRALTEALHTLMTVCFFAERRELWEPVRAAAARLRPRPPASLALTATLFADPARATSAEVEQLEAMIGSLPAQADPAVIVRVGRTAFFVDRMAGCREAHWRVVRDGRAGGAVASAIHALINLCLDDYQLGQWDESHQLAEEGIALCNTHGYRALAWPFRFALAIVAAACGDDDATRALSDEMDTWAAPRGAGVVQTYARHARAMTALALRRLRARLRRARFGQPPRAASLRTPRSRSGTGSTSSPRRSAPAATPRQSHTAKHCRKLRLPRYGRASPC